MEAIRESRNKVAILMRRGWKAVKQNKLWVGGIACLSIGDVESIYFNRLIGNRFRADGRGRMSMTYCFLSVALTDPKWGHFNHAIGKSLNRRNTRDVQSADAHTLI